MTPDEIKALVRTVPDFPAPGILFRDITTLIAHGEGLSATLDHLAGAARHRGAEAIAGLEARGFIFGAMVAARLGLGFVPLRKPGKLPVDTIGVDYALEYGHARLELDPTLIEDGEQVVLVDDLIATGGTARAGASLLRQAGARVEHALFVIDLPELGGADALRSDGVEPWSLMAFKGH
jgi:adenine phosphoribosyltransferase